MSEQSAPKNPELQRALAEGEMRYFRAGRGSAQGRTGPEDTARFGENLMVLQECAILIGEKLGMHAVASVVAYENEETIGFCFDPNSNPHEPLVAGGIINRRIPVRQFVESVREYINE